MDVTETEIDASDDIQHEFTGVVFIEGQDIDTEFEGSINVPSNDEFGSESGSQCHKSEQEPEEVVSTSTKFKNGHTQNCGAVGKS